MPRLPLLALLAAVASGVSAQNVTPDTLDWRGYFPLEEGTVREWRVWANISYRATGRTEVVGDTAIGGHTYAVQWEALSERDPVYNIDRDTDRRLFLRYDAAGRRVVALDTTSGIEWGYTCDLGESFGATASCDAPDGPYEVSYFGEDYGPGSSVTFLVGADSVRVRAIKGVGSFFVGGTYYYGIGLLPPEGEGTSMGGSEFTYLRLSGREYGRSFVAAEAPPVAASRLRAYPNPARGWVTVEGEGDRVEVSDVLGRRVRSEAAPQRGPLRLGLGGLAPGPYVVRRGGAAVVVTVR